MWRPDIRIETATYPAGGVAPSTHALTPHNYIRKSRGPATPRISVV
jgi:hypothetical protein